MKLDRELAEEATGGHGPIQYVVTEYKPGKKIKFKFLEPANFQGNHWFEIEEKEDKRTEITHTIDMNVSGAAILSWIFIIRPMHDALIEDSFDKAALNLGLNIREHPIVMELPCRSNLACLVNNFNMLRYFFV
ncbi:hypothetical protein JWJ90_22295 [Desulfobulbus rhabdoformis]|uniref:hypothetical protein n=1 Tax=Desulfobulbus rhabdoformis TaxID=34032 RepID=UPI001966CB1E|nr:hypothetical protein [Desulfobulbus rhabdoformis]MBM9616995.1 hypothetical protein [Desulfobulbus rhabdoformis]